jgi:hypoxanthine phosphoribosyltransferase
MVHVNYTGEQIKGYLFEIIRRMAKDNYRPDYIVGLTRGGLIPAVKLSQYLEIPMHALSPDETNCWMAEDAYEGKKILVVDDINDTGKTIRELKEDWRSTCHPDSERWPLVFASNVKFATLIDNEASEQFVNYAGLVINKLENPEWCVFPWERWWMK